MNIIYIGTDSWRADHLGCYGNQTVKTPYLDQLAAEGVRFNNVYADGLPTIPHRRVIWTGKSILPEGEWRPMDDKDVTQHEIFQRTGYRTALIADLYHMFKPGMNYHRGFDYWEWIRGQEGDGWAQGPRESVNPLDHVPEHLLTPQGAEVVKGYVLNTADRRSEDDFFCARTCNSAMRWLEHNAHEQPFVLWLEMFDPHEPWDAPRRFQEMYCDPPLDRYLFGYGTGNGQFTDEDMAVLKGQYAAEVTFSDECIGRLLNRVDELGLMDDTVIVFTTDHGTHIGEQGCVQKTATLLNSCVAQLPLIIRHPDTKQFGGKVVDGLVSAIDYAGTILGLADQEPDEAMEGFDFWTLAEGKADTIRDEVFVGMWGYGAIRNKDWHYFNQVGKKPFPGGRNLAPQLYDLANDPGETVDVKDQHPEIVKDLDARLQERFSRDG